MDGHSSIYETIRSAGQIIQEKKSAKRCLKQAQQSPLSLGSSNRYFN
jgi:hypothetical protein